MKGIMKYTLVVIRLVVFTVETIIHAIHAGFGRISVISMPIPIFMGKRSTF